MAQAQPHTSPQQSPPTTTPTTAPRHLPQRQQSQHSTGAESTASAPVTNPREQYPFLSELVEDRIYPFVEQFMGFLGLE